MVWVMVDNKKVMQAGGLANLTDFTVDLLQTYPYSPFS